MLRIYCQLFFLGWASLLSGQENPQPNFLILLADDISASSLGCYGSKNANTSPHIDRLAKEGVCFTNMFVSEAICAPARAELYTGLQPHRNGCSVNHQATRKDVLSVVQHLEPLGYRVGLAGKTHIKPQSVYPFEKVKGFPANANVKNTPDADWSGVKDFISRDSAEPFCLFICSIHAHSPWDSGDPSFWKLADLKLPPHLGDTPKTRHFFREYLAEVRLFDDQVGRARTLLEELGLEQNTVLIVLDENGAGMPCGKWTNYDWGVRSACVMKWPHLGGDAFVTEALAQYCDIVPTLIDAAGGKVPKELDGQSLLPLLSGKTNQHREEAFFTYTSGPVGPPFVSRAVTDGQFKLMWNLTPERLFGVRTINGFDFGYVDQMEDRHVRQVYQSWLEKEDEDEAIAEAIQRFRKQPEFQLYDLSKDPWERENLALKPEFATRVKEMKESILAWMDQQGDEGAVWKKAAGSENSKKRAQE